METSSYGNISDSKDIIIRELSPISPVIYTVLETANAIVPECMEIIKTRCTNLDLIPQRVNSYFYPSLMRAIVQYLLHSKNVKTQALVDHDGKVEDILDWECKILSNNGLFGTYARYNYRILKALYGKLPPPGASSKKRDYYCQGHLKQSKMKLFPDEDSNLQKPNVIYLWNNIGASGVTLSLSCPKWGNITKAIDYFTEPIPHPVLTYKPDVVLDDILREINLDLLNPEVIINPEDEEKDDIR